MNIEEIYTDKSLYNPGDIVKIFVDLKNRSNKELKNIKFIISATNLGESICEPIKISIDKLNRDEEKNFEVEWVAPNEDFKGYLIKASIENDNGREYCNKTVGVDVSSSWIKFPRYGYLHCYDENIDGKNKIDLMNRYHINGIEYYDWKYLHHKPIADGVSKENLGVWQDWAGRNIYGQTIKNYINNAKERNMVNMAYNMIYAGTNTFFWDLDGNKTKPNQWKLQFAQENERGIGDFTFRMGGSPSGNSNLYFLNPLNEEWQEYIFAEEMKVFEVLDFDGWHGDTVGDWGEMTTVDGKPLGYDEEGNPINLVTDTYTQFLNKAKEILGDKYLSFNPVGAKGIENVNISNVDVLYTEFWPWDSDREGNKYDTYYSLAREVERTMNDSRENSIDGRGKSLVVKAYINYDKVGGYMNEPAVILCDAAVYAAGGSRLEIGNGDNMLHHEYYPNDNVLMSDNLKAYMEKMSNFIVAYENILRDGQVTTDNKVEIKNIKSSKDGSDDTVWTYTREDNSYEILHLINLLETDNKWRDDIGNKNAPKFLKNINIRYYTNSDIKEIRLASPDIYNCISRDVEFKKSFDSNGNYLEFNIESLEYWNMIYLKKDK